jgi:ABC-2 type transport system ATP-binding protein
MIKVENMSKRYAGRVAVDNISFEVQKGEIVGFLGPNGAGKTTTMRVLTCFMPPSEGSASVAGFDVMRQPMEVKRRIGYLPETPPLYPEMEVAEYLRFAGRLKGIGKAELAVRVQDAMKRCNVDDRATTLISKLSKGYKQRVGLAQAIIHNPEVLILDEPTSGLDPKQINETRDLIKSLAGDHTIILSTHILPEVEAICEKVVIISAGKVVATDTVESLTHGLRGMEAVAMEIEGADAAAVTEKLSQVAGVARVLTKGNVMPGAAYTGLRFEVEGEPGRVIRPELARAVIEAGWRLHEMHSRSVSLESVFLELTAADVDAAAANAQEAA